MKTCPFCDTIVRKGTNSEEHLLRKAWIRRLKQEKHGVHSKRYATGSWDIEHQSWKTPMNMVAGGICKSCNEGWMHDIDVSVDHIVMGEAEGDRMLDRADEGERRSVARWLAKTALCARFTEPPDRRHVDPAMYARMMAPEYVPPGLLACCSRIPDALPFVGYSIMDVWPLSGPAMLKGIPVHRFKFAAQYGQAIFYCAWADVPRPIYNIGWDESITVVWSKGSVWRWANPLEFDAPHRVLRPNPRDADLLQYFIGLERHS